MPDEDTATNCCTRCASACRTCRVKGLQPGEVAMAKRTYAFIAMCTVPALCAVVFAHPTSTLVALWAFLTDGATRGVVNLVCTCGLAEFVHDMASYLESCR